MSKETDRQRKLDRVFGYCADAGIDRVSYHISDKNLDIAIELLNEKDFGIPRPRPLYGCSNPNWATREDDLDILLKANQWTRRRTP